MSGETSGRSVRRPRSLVHRVRQQAIVAGAGRPPLLLLFHGVGSNELSMASIADRFDPRFVVISARSPIEVGAFSFAWFPVEFTPNGPVIDRDEIRAATVQAGRFVEEAVDAYDADREHVFVAGFSQGGIIALATLLAEPDMVAGAVCMSGRLPPELLPPVVSPDRLRAKPVLIVHGARDETLVVDYGRRAAAELGRLGLDVEYREFDMAHTATDESLATVSAWLTARLPME
jgi:phospholipase/carboxylesterase